VKCACYLINDSCHEKPDLHEQEVCCGIKKGQVGEGEVVVQAVQPGRDHVVGQDLGVLGDLANEGYHRVAEKIYISLTYWQAKH
jgi:hypothetical protein